MEELKKYRCSMCNKEFVTPGLCEEHSKIHHAEPTLFSADYDPDEEFPHEIDVEFSDGYHMRYIIPSSMSDRRYRHDLLSAFKGRRLQKRKDRK